MTCVRCFHHSVYYFIVFLTPESTLNDGQGSRSITRPHIKSSVLFLPRFMRKAESFVIDFFSLPSDYACSFTNASRIVQEKRTATPVAAEQVYHCLGALSWLVSPLTWNAPMRQSGAIGAWRLAAGRDNLL